MTLHRAVEQVRKWVPSAIVAREPTEHGPQALRKEHLSMIDDQAKELHEPKRSAGTRRLLSCSSILKLSQLTFSLLACAPVSAVVRYTTFFKRWTLDARRERGWIDCARELEQQLDTSRIQTSGGDVVKGLECILFDLKCKFPPRWNEIPRLSLIPLAFLSVFARGYEATRQRSLSLRLFLQHPRSTRFFAMFEFGLALSGTRLGSFGWFCRFDVDGNHLLASQQEPPPSFVLPIEFRYSPAASGAFVPSLLKRRPQPQQRHRPFTLLRWERRKEEENATEMLPRVSAVLQV